MDAPPDVGGYYDGVTLKRRLVLPEEGTPTTDQLVYLYSNKMMDEGMPFDRVYRLNSDGMHMLAKVGTTDAFVAGGKISFVDGYGASPPDISVNNDEGERGMLDGVMGTFTCDVASCTVTKTDDGTSSADELRFTPDAGMSTATVMVPDSDYLIFGWWLAMPEAVSDTHMFESFAGGSDSFDVSPSGDTIQQLTGRARYEGPAAGKYVTKDRAELAMAGIFTATAQLLADFGLANEDGMIQGQVIDFMDMDGNEMEDWSVRLHDAELQADDAAFMSARIANAADTVDDESLNTGVVASLGTGMSATGDWHGSFYSNDRSDGEPGSVAGRFEAHGDRAHISGAFGAMNTGADE
jgi:hypothetical protein